MNQNIKPWFLEPNARASKGPHPRVKHEQVVTDASSGPCQIQTHSRGIKQIQFVANFENGKINNSE